MRENLGVDYVFGLDVRRRKMLAFVPEPWRKTILGLSMVMASGLKNGMFSWLRERFPTGEIPVRLVGG